jgi:dsDNA-specific endonuclease/ATPase MutS2
MGTLDDDMSNLTFQRGFSLLNEDIMSLVDQVRPVYTKGEIIEQHVQEVEKIKEKLKKHSTSDERFPTSVELLQMGLPKISSKDKSSYFKKSQKK